MYDVVNNSSTFIGRFCTFKLHRGALFTSLTKVQCAWVLEKYTLFITFFGALMKSSRNKDPVNGVCKTPKKILTGLSGKLSKEKQRDPVEVRLIVAFIVAVFCYIAICYFQCTCMLTPLEVVIYFVYMLLLLVFVWFGMLRCIAVFDHWMKMSRQPVWR